VVLSAESSQRLNREHARPHPNPLPEERAFSISRFLELFRNGMVETSDQKFDACKMDSPSPGGEGRDEGEQSLTSLSDLRRKSRGALSHPALRIPHLTDAL
jgi:hypothetical protein